MTFYNVNDMAARELVPGFHGRFIHTDHVTLAFWEVEAGAMLPEHAHPHEQITTVLEGQFEMRVAGQTQVLQAGEAAAIPGHASHAGRALTPCRLVDVFHPARDDYRY